MTRDQAPTNGHFITEFFIWAPMNTKGPLKALMVVSQTKFVHVRTTTRHEFIILKDPFPQC
jgi:hypothetical protein